MPGGDDEDVLLRSVALQNAQAILAVRQRAEEELRAAKVALECRTSELAHSVALLRATLEASTDGILVTDNEGRVLDFNEKYVSFWNLPHDLMAARMHGPLIEAAAAQFAQPAEFMRRIQEIYDAALPESFDLLHLADGRVCERYSRLQFVEGRNAGRVWTFRDVTTQHRTEEALREEGRMLELLNKTGVTLAGNLELQPLLQKITDAATELSGARFGAFFYNTTGSDGDALMLYTLSGAPRAAFERFGHPRATTLFGPTFRGEAPIRSDDILQDPRYGRSGPHHGMPAGHLPVRSYLAVPVVSRFGVVIGGLFFGHPDTAVFNARSERLIVGIAAQAAVAIDNARLYEAAQQAADERSRLLESEREARRLAEEQNQSKDAFLAMLGHELRNPLGAISAGVAVIEAAGPVASESVRAYDVIARQSAHLRRIVDDLLDAARMLAGKIALDKGEVDLADSVRACMHALETSGRTRGYTLQVELQSAVLDADPVRIEQIVSNLVVNAIKYTPSGGTIVIRVIRVEADALLEVSDTGVGIPPDLIGTIFDPFVQGARSLDRAQGGLGIGLTLVRKLAELHGGSVDAASDGIGMGSTFSVRLPLAEMKMQSVAAVPADAPVRRRCVLVVEDNPDVLETTSCLLELSGFDVLRACTGHEGMEVARTGKPEVAIVDVGLPDLDGYEVARRLRADAMTARLHLIALTGYGTQEDVHNALEAGFDLHMIKPLDFDQLVLALDSIPLP